MQHPDEGTIHAWLDGQLSAEEGTELEAHAATCAECAASIAEARGIVAASSRIVSSLDIVPGDVIPVRAPVKRAWYSTTQFRAAAAVVFVAGASVVLTRGGDSPTFEEASRQAAPLSLESPAASASEPVADAQAPTPARAATPTQDGAANLAAKSPAPPAAPAPPPAAPEAEWTGKGMTATPERDASARTTAVGAAAGSREMSQQSAPPVVVMAEELQVMRVDSTARARTTVYLVPPGVEVSLIETTEVKATAGTVRLLDERLTTGVQAMSKTAAPPPPPAAARAPQVAVRGESADAISAASITWTDSTTNTVFLLSGPVARQRLEEIRKLIEQKRRP